MKNKSILAKSKKRIALGGAIVFMVFNLEACSVSSKSSELESNSDAKTEINSKNNKDNKENEVFSQEQIAGYLENNGFKKISIKSLNSDYPDSGNLPEKYYYLVEMPPDTIASNFEDFGANPNAAPKSFTFLVYAMKTENVTCTLTISSGINSEFKTAVRWSEDTTKHELTHSSQGLFGVIGEDLTSPSGEALLDTPVQDPFITSTNSKDNAKSYVISSIQDLEEQNNLLLESYLEAK